MFKAGIKTLDWMVYTLYSDNEPRVAEIAKVELNEYGKIGNLVLGDYISLRITEITKFLAQAKITSWKAEYGSP